MLHLTYILVFTFLALLAVSNLIRSLITLSAETQKFYPSNYNPSGKGSSIGNKPYRGQTIHPELLDEGGKVIDEPLLVMRSVSVEDARSQLDALYEASPSSTNDPEE